MTKRMTPRLKWLVGIIVWYLDDDNDIGRGEIKSIRGDIKTKAIDDYWIDGKWIAYRDIFRTRKIVRLERAARAAKKARK